MSFTEQQQRTLLELARSSIAHGLRHGRAEKVDPASFEPALQCVLASFVTLERDGHLRGCIGALEARQPLVADVAEHAFAAAFRDPRFSPMAAEELAGLDIHISVLSPSERLPIEDEEELLGVLRPGIDGLIISDGVHRATFLPSVWASLPEPRDFVAHLKRKAGIAPEETLYSAWRYTAESIPAD